MKNKIQQIIAITIAGLILNTLGFPKEDLVEELEQMPDISFGLYSGYLPVNGTKKELHYIAALSKNDPLIDPVVLWFNGGPGCSSLLGFTQEHGPYVIGDFDTEFKQNRHSWNNEVTMVYLEMPAGVGFSHCGDSSECHFTDNSTADDNLIAILNFFEMKFPQLKKNDLYISGESYAGIYIPYLTYRIDQYIQEQEEEAENSRKFLPNLKGIIIGNGVTDFQYDCIPAFLQMSHYNGMIEETLYKHLSDNCNYTDFMIKKLKGEQSNNATCDYYFDKWMDTIVKLNIYDIYGKCYQNDSYFQKYSLYDSFDKYFLQDDDDDDTKYEKNTFSSNEYTPWLYPSKNFRKLGKGLPSCDSGLPAQKYLNNPTVRQQLHIPKHVQPWDMCAGSTLSYIQEFRGSIWAYNELKGRYRILKYSGDTDGAVPTVGTQKWISVLDWTIKEEWRPYFYDRQVAGYIEVRDGLTFASIHGAGHMTPMLKPAETYHLIFNWIFNRRI